MGTWGTSLYAGDFAMDLRSTISAVAHLPFDADRLLEILCESEPDAANNPDDEDYTIFWLVVADQFAKRGIVCDRVHDTALRIIDVGSDVATLAKLGMSARDLRKRQKTLTDLRARVVATSAPAKPRPVLKQPQTFLMDVGEVFVYPTSGGGCINSYFRSKEQMPGGWSPDGWGAAVIVERGRAFDFLTWYRPLTISRARTAKPSLDAKPALDTNPTLDELRSEYLWVLKRPGTCPPIHFKRMELEKIGAVAIDRDKVARAFPTMPSARTYAVDNISIVNSLTIGPQLPMASIHVPGQPPNLGRGRPYPAIASLDEILAA
jgi:hypothetical protein